MFAWFFISALYLQQVLGYTPMQVGLAFLPSNLIMAAFSLGLSAKVVMRYGLRLPIMIGLTLSAIGLGLFSVSPVDGSFLVHVLPGMLLLGIGTGLALNPVLLAAMSDVGPDESGLASGVVNTAFMMGGAVGLAVLASMAGATTGELLADGASTAEALNSGYQLAFLLGALCAVMGAILGVLLRPGQTQEGAIH
jgi:MFS family permease